MHRKICYLHLQNGPIDVKKNVDIKFCAQDMFQSHAIICRWTRILDLCTIVMLGAVIIVNLLCLTNSLDLIANTKMQGLGQGYGV
jgi:hypothetical protein